LILALYVAPLLTFGVWRLVSDHRRRSRSLETVQS
jgi:hypothetical protein